jgi:F-type H+-transporting ATPase subunit delta
MAVAHRIYAQSLLGAARDHDRVGSVRADFAEFAAALDASPELRGFLRNPQIDARAKQDVLDALLAEADELFRNFLRLLGDKNRVDQIAEVYDEFEKLLAREERVLRLDLTTAVDLSDEEAAEIVRRIEEASGRRVETTRSVDPTIIGGIVVQAGSLRVDASVRGRLNQLREELATRI